MYDRFNSDQNKQVTVHQPSVPSISASTSGSSYDSAFTSRRASRWNPTRLGPTATLWSTLDLQRARSRDEIRNNPHAASACDTFEAQVVGDGIWPHWNLKNKAKKKELETLFRRWARRVNFQAMIGTATREVFEAGEVLCQFLVRPLSWGYQIPLDLQLIEGEQLPIFLNTMGAAGTFTAGVSMPNDHTLRAGIEFDQFNRRVAYQMYKVHPGETMFYPLTGLAYIRVPADDIVHCYKVRRAGLLRGQPHLATVLMALHELDKYTDATVVAKQIQTMFAAFLETTDPTADILPPERNVTATDNPQIPPSPPPGVDDSVLEPGTIQKLFPGEQIKFPNLPANTDLEAFVDFHLHKIAVGCGLNHELITGNLKGVNLASIRAGRQDFQRKCTQFLRHTLIGGLIAPIVKRWTKEAVLSGAIFLPGYSADPEQYDDIDWGVPGWPWTDPLKDVQAKQISVRSGFDSRTGVAAEQGNDATLIDEQNQSDNERAESLGLVYDSNAKTTLVKGTKMTGHGEGQTGGPAGVLPDDPSDDESNDGAEN